MTRATRTLISLGLAHALLEWFSGFWPIFKALAHLDLPTCAKIVAVTGFISSLLQPAFGAWADRGSARAMALGGTALTALLTLVGPIANQTGTWGPFSIYLMLATLTMFSRFGHSMFHPAGATLAARASDDASHTANLGVFVSMGWIGFGLSQVAFAAAYVHFGGHTEILLLPGAVFMAWIMLWCKPDPLPHTHTRAPWSSIRHDLWQYKSALTILFLLSCLTSAANAALFFLMPEFLLERGYTGFVFNGGAQGFMIAGTAVGVVVSGGCDRRWGERLTLIVAMVANIVAWHGFLMTPHISDPLFLSVCFVTGWLFGFGSTLPISMGQKMLPRSASMISGVMMGWSWAVANLAPVIAAELSVTYGIYFSLSVLGIVNVLALVFSLFLKPAAQAIAEESHATIPSTAPSAAN